VQEPAHAATLYPLFDIINKSNFLWNWRTLRFILPVVCATVEEYSISQLVAMSMEAEGGQGGTTTYLMV